MKKDNKLFQCIVTVVLNHGEIKEDPQRIQILSLLRINITGKENRWKKFEKNSLTIALNVFYAKNEKAYLACVLKSNSNCENKLFF